MNNIKDMNNISIEQFAAFLDGNLVEEEIQQVGEAIDSNKEFSAILGEAMQVDELVEKYEGELADLKQEILDTDFDLPVVPVWVGPTDMVEVIGTYSSDTVELRANEEVEDVSEPLEGTGSIDGSYPSAPYTSMPNEDYSVGQQPDEMVDYGE